MGSYAALRIGKCTVGDWKSHVALEPFLMFSADDFLIGSETDTEGENYQTFKFKTTAAKARHRLDERGVTLELCRDLYDEFRSDLLWKWDPVSHEGSNEPNEVSFDNYRTTLGKQLATRVYRRLANEDEAPPDATEEQIGREGFFEGDFYRYFSDAAFCLNLRLMLEAANPEDSVELDLTDLVHGGYLDEDRVSELYCDYFQLMVRRITLDYSIYGFVINKDPRLRMRLRERLESLKENELIQFILMPLLERMGFQRLRRVKFHGPGEFGSDILPFRYRTPLGTMEYYALQAKAVQIHGSSSQPGNAAEIVSQATQALAVSFVDDLDNERKRLDKFIIATSRGISANARQFVENAIEGRRSLQFLEADRIIDLLLQHDLAQYVLFSEFDRGAVVV